jgi:hypothetical protein
MEPWGASRQRVLSKPASRLWSRFLLRALFLFAEHKVCVKEQRLDDLMQVMDFPEQLEDHSHEV